MDKMKFPYGAGGVISTSQIKTGRSAANSPGGDVEGFADSIYSFFRSVYADILAGSRSQTTTYASFENGHYEMLFCDAVLQSAKEHRWVDVEGAGAC